MNLRGVFVLTLLTFASATASGARLEEIVDRRVPTLRDGGAMSQDDVEQAILAACGRYRFQVLSHSPGTVTARYTHRKYWFDVDIVYTAAAYSIRYKASEGLAYDAAKSRIDDDYNDFTAGLNAHIRGQLAIALDRMKDERKVANAAR